MTSHLPQKEILTSTATPNANKKKKYMIFKAKCLLHINQFTELRF